MEIITGYTGENHVTSADDASLYRGILGQDDYVLEVGNKFAATIIDNNTVRVMDGDLVIQGHQGRIRANDYNEVTVDNGTPGQKRNDLIVARYVKSTTTGIESIALEVIKGIPGVTATDPDVVQGNLTIGATQRDYPLYRVSLNGLALENVTSLFTTIPNLKVLKTHLAENANKAHGGFKGALLVVSNNISIPNDSNTFIPWGSTWYGGSEGFFDLSDPQKIKVPSGVSKVRVSASVIWASSGDKRRITIMRNGEAEPIMAQEEQSGTSTSTAISMPVLFVNPGDYFVVRAWQDTGSAINILKDPRTWFSMEVIE